MCRTRQGRDEVIYCTMHLGYAVTMTRASTEKFAIPRQALGFLKPLFRKALTSTVGYVLIKFTLHM